MQIVEKEYDSRSSCWSILATLTIKEYHKIAYSAFESGGNIYGQRDVIRKSTVAAKIRKRMNDDFVAGAIFPHVVIGILVDDSFLHSIQDAELANCGALLSRVLESPSESAISIIDGMQRSNIYFNNMRGNESRTIRVEFWVTDIPSKLLYRMLVLNTGQVPWNTRRQIEVVFSSISNSIIQILNTKYSELKDIIEIINVDDEKRCTQAAKFKRSTMIEMYLAFYTRKVKVDMQDELAEEFQRFDMIEAIDKNQYFDLFVDTFAYLCLLDLAFARKTTNLESVQFRDGKDIFRSVPACIGFVVACAEYTIGKMTVERQEVQIASKNSELKHRIGVIIEKVDSSNNSDYLALQSLNDMISQLSRSKIGDEMRLRFKNCFTEMLLYPDIEEITSLEGIWRT